MHTCISRGICWKFIVQLEEIEVVECIIIISNLIIALVSVFVTSIED